MRYSLVTLLLLTYPGLLAGVYWIPSSGPRSVHQLSVATDGSFTTSSHTRYGRGAIDYWAPDLTHRKTINLSGYRRAYSAHALSPDGDTVAAVTTDVRSRTIELVSVAEDTLKVTIDAPVSARTLYFCGSKESTLLISDGDNAFVCSPGGKQNQRLQAMSGRPLSAFGSQYFAIHQLVRATDSSGEVQYDKECRFYDAETTPLRLIYREKRPSADWDGQGVAIGSDGSIAVQHPDHIQFRGADGSQRKIEWPMERGRLWKIDPTLSYLLLADQRFPRTVMIVDAGTGKVLASRKTANTIRECKFQDSAHLLMTEAGDDSVTGRVVRWNWREDTAITKTLWGTTAESFDRRLKWLGVAVLLWFFAGTWVARTSHRRLTPTAVLAAVAVLGCIWAYNHPEMEQRSVNGYFHNLTWLVLTTIWLVIPVHVCLAVCRAPDKLARRLPILILVSSLSAGRLHHLHTPGSWFFPLILLFVLIWLVGASMVINYRLYWRRKSLQVDGAVSVSSQSASFRWVYLLLLIAAIVVALVVLSNLPILVLLSVRGPRRLFTPENWFVPLILLFVLIWLVGAAIIIYRRKKSLQNDGAMSVSSHSTSFRLMDLLLLTAAIAVALAVLSNFDGFDQGLSSLAWARDCSIGLAFLAAIGGWSGLSNAAWWKRYPPLVVFTFSVAFYFSQNQWIEGGRRFPSLSGGWDTGFAALITAFTAFIAYAAWLYRGTMIVSQADAVTEPGAG